MSASDKKKFRKEQEAAALTEKQLAQKKADKQLKTYTLTFVVVMILVVAIAVGSLGITWFQNSGIPARSTVAVTIGSTELSNADLNYYFMDAVNNFYSDLYNQYSTYTTMIAQAYFGLNMSQPLGTQIYDEETGATWADYFTDTAISYAEGTYALVNQAKAEGFTLSEEQQTTLNASLAATIANAGKQGYSNFDDYLKAMYGAGANEENFVKYMTDNALANAFYSARSESLTFDKEIIDAYNKEHYDEFSFFSYSYYYISVSSHEALLTNANNTEDGEEGSTEPTDAADARPYHAEAMALARAEADSVTAADSLLTMNKLITELASNTAKKEATVITSSLITKADKLYADWLKSADRKSGDTAVFEYESESDNDELVDGYYVVLFQEREDNNTMMIDIRHALIKFQGGTTQNGTTVYSDEEKKTARDEAQALYDEWVSGGATEEAFIELAKENSDDSNAAQGGLYEDVFDGYMVASFNDWCFAEGRKAGDHGIVETEFGYHLMYFVGHADQTYREYAIESTLRSEALSEWYKGLTENVTSTKGNTSYVNRNLIIAPASSAIG